MLKLRDVMSRWDAGQLSQSEAAELLGMHERTFRRWAPRFEEDGEAGLLDRRLGRRSGRSVPDRTRDEASRPGASGLPRSVHDVPASVIV